MNDLHREIAKLTPEQRKLVELMLKNSVDTDFQIPILPRGGDPNYRPLSNIQERFWYVDQFSPESAAYNIVKGVRFTGKLDLAVLERSLNAIIDRHEILRTGCENDNGNVRSFLIQNPRSPIPVIDLGDVVEISRNKEAERLSRLEGRRPLDLSQPPLLRATLFRLTDREHILILVSHDFVADADSVMLAIKELAANYTALITGKSTIGTKLPIQYADFAHWQHKQVSGRRLETLLSYWKNQLEDAPYSIDIPVSSKRSIARSHQGLKHWFTIGNPLAEKIRQHCREDNSTLYTFFIAAFHGLIHAYSSQKKIVTSTDPTDRDRPEVQDLIGQFSSTVLLRTDFSDDPSPRQLRKHVHRVFAEAYEHRGLPFEKLVELLKPGANWRGIPAFRVMFNYYEKPANLDISLPGCNMSLFPVEHGAARSDLILYIMAMDKGFSGYLEYISDQLSSGAIAQMEKDYLALLGRMVAGPDRRISELIKLAEIKSPLDDTPDSTEIQAAQPLSDQSTEADRRFIAPRTPYEKSLEEIWCVVLDLDRISIDDNFFELGGHSLIATNLVYKIHDAYNFYMPISQLFQTPTIAGLAEYVQSVYQGKVPSRRKGALLPIQTQGERRPIFLIPGGGGGEPEFLIYAPLINLLGMGQPVYGLQARGIDGSQTPHTYVETMAEEYFLEMQNVQPKGPYFLVGECIGGKVAYELARHIRDRGEKVGLLVLMNSELIPESMNPLRKVQYSLQTQRVRYHLDQLKSLTFRERWEYLSQRMLGRIFSTSIDKEDQSGQRTQQVRDHYRRTLMGYKPTEGYSGKITLLVSKDHYRHNHSMGWEPFALGELEIHQLPGDHDSYIGTHVDEAAAKLSACLESAQLEAKDTGDMDTGVSRG
jgi:thioesterase domain-containing protein/acyl carrier protein